MPRSALRLRVGGLTLAALAPEPTAALDPPPELVAFLVRRGGDIRLRLLDEPPPAPAARDLLFRSGGVWSVHRHAERLLYSFRSAAARPPVYKAVLIDEGLRSGRLYFPRGSAARPVYALDFPLDELLFQHRLALEGALEVHACGIVHGGGALAFCGVSGAGKSTTARLWRRHSPESPALSDDRLVFRRRGGRFWACGTPWHGDGGFASPAQRPLRAVFFLRHGARTRVRRLPPPEAAARLLARSFPPAWRREAVTRCLAACAEIAAALPCHELQFRPDASAVAAVKDAL